MSARFKFPTYEVRVQRLNESPGSLKVDTPTGAHAYWREKVATTSWYDRERECCVSLHLNTRLSALGHSLVSIGTLNESVAHPRDVFRAAVALGAYAVLVVHNHPSGDPSPSEADRRFTRRLAECGELLQIALLDHIIIGIEGDGRPPWFSFREAGLI